MSLESDIMNQQVRAHRAMYDPMEIAQWDRDREQAGRKREFLNLLRTDRQFREEVKKILEADET